MVMGVRMIVATFVLMSLCLGGCRTSHRVEVHNATDRAVIVSDERLINSRSSWTPSSRFREIQRGHSAVLVVRERRVGGKALPWTVMPGPTLDVAMENPQKPVEVITARLNPPGPFIARVEPSPTNLGQLRVVRIDANGAVIESERRGR